MSAWVYAAAVLACAVGACGRYGLSLVVPAPWSTFVANVIGSALLGAAARAALGGHHSELLLIAGAGLAGGLTTFSALSLDAADLWSDGRRPFSVAYGAATLAAGVAAAALGWHLVS